MYIAIEGIDTSGKSTQVSKLQTLYPEASITKEPGGTPLGSGVREMVLNTQIESPNAELFLFLADRAEHIKRIIEPALKDGTMVISDRSIVSGVAYAMAQKVFKSSFLLDINLFAAHNIVPQYVFILKLDAETLKARLGNKEHDAIESRGIEYLLTIQELLIQAANDLKLNYYLVDATREVDEITKTIVTTLQGKKND